MRKVLLAISIAAVGAAAGYLVRRMEEKGAFDKLKDDVDACLAKGKKYGRNLVDCSKNEIQYIQDRAQQIMGREKSKANDLIDSAKDSFNKNLDE